jgi:hypothetical protein
VPGGPSEEIGAAPLAGTWHYWWNWSEPIHTAPAGAADAIRRALAAVPPAETALTGASRAGEHATGQARSCLPDPRYPMRKGAVMTDPENSSAADWIREIAADLDAAGILATVNGDHITGLDATAAAQPPGRGKAEVMVDEDGYAEVRWNLSTEAPPADITAAITRVLAAVTTDPHTIARQPTPA